MKDPTRLLDASADEYELMLLRAAASEQPPAAAAQRLAERLGVRPAQLPHAAAGRLSLVPVGVLAVGITLAGVVWFAAQPARPSAATVPQPAVERRAPAALPEAPSPAASASPPPSPAPSPEPRATEAVQDSSLALEIARIDAIRRLLTSDRVQAASAALQDYQRDFPSGVLRQEADVLSIEAVQRAGDRRRARQLASRFLAQHPDSPHSARVRDLLQTLGSDAR
jgi:TolA-binding protein